MGKYGTNRTEFLPDTDENNADSYEGTTCFVATKKAMFLVVVAVLAAGLVLAALFVYGPNASKLEDDDTFGDLEKVLNNTVNKAKTKPFYLPRFLYPLHYRLRIRPELNDSNSNNATFRGNVTIILHCRKETDHIFFHAKDLQMSNVKLLLSIIQNNEFDQLVKGFEPNIRKVEEIPILEVKNYSSHLHRINLDKTLEATKNYTLHIDFSGKIRNNFQGIYKTNMGTDQKMRWFLSTYFRPIYARNAFPCLDDPFFKSFFKISIARKTSLKSISNLPLVETEAIEDQPGWVWDHFETSPLMPTYAVFFTIFDFNSTASAIPAGPVYNIWTSEDMSNYTKYASENIPKIFNYIQSYFGVKYPLPKIDFVVTPAVPENSVEGFGVISIRDSAFLIDPESASDTMKSTLFKLIARELCHQWLGNLVTMDKWSDIWIIEGFATFLENLIEKEINPSLYRDDQFIITETILTADTLKTQNSLDTQLKYPFELQQLFDATSYNKGSCIFEMLNTVLTKPIVQAGIQNFTKTWQYRSTNKTYLWQSFSEAAENGTNLPNNVSVETVMDSWVKESGFPTVTFNRNNATNSFVATQKKFNDDSSDSLWYIPLACTTKENDTLISTVWLNKEKSVEFSPSTRPSSDSWIMCNTYRTGLYRVNYEANNWDLLQQQLNEDYTQMNASNRAQLIADAFALASVSQLDYKVPFGLINYLSLKEKEYLPWYILSNTLHLLKMAIGPSSHYGTYRSFVIRLVAPLYDELGTEEQPGESQNIKSLRVLILSMACRVHYSPCVKWSRKMYDSWMASPEKNPIAFDFREVVQCTAISAGGYQEWEFLWNTTFSPSTSPADLKLAYLTLGCTKELWVIYSYLEETLNGNIALQNIPYVFQSLISSEGIHSGFTYVRINWEQIYKTFKDSYTVLKSLFEGFLSRLSSEVDLADLTFFYNDYKHKLDIVAPMMLNVVDQVKMRIAWREKFLNTVIALLKEEKSTTRP